MKEQLKENATEFRRISLPYVLQKQEDGSYVVLNRIYKPIGFLTNEWVDYQEYPIGIRFKRLRQDTIKKLAIHDRPDGDIYLYDDGCIPTDGKKKMTAYLEKLAILMKLDVY